MTQLKQSKPLLLRIVSLAWVIVAIGFAGLVLVQGSAEFGKQSFRLNPWLIGVSFLVACSGLLVAIFAWRRILSCYGVHQRFRDDVRNYCYGALGLTIPGGIWAIVGRSVLYERMGARGSQVAEASVIETLVTGLAAMGVYFCSFFVRPDTSVWKRPEIAVGFSILLLILIQPKVFGYIRNWLRRRLHKGDSSPVLVFRSRDLAEWFVLEAIVVTIGGSALYVLLTSLMPVPLSVLLSVTAAWAAGAAAANLFFWLPGTPVLRDGTILLILSPVLPLPVAIAFVILVRIYSIASLVLMASVIWLWLDSPLGRKLHSQAFSAHMPNSK